MRSYRTKSPRSVSNKRAGNVAPSLSFGVLGAWAAQVEREANGDKKSTVSPTLAPEALEAAPMAQPPAPVKPVEEKLIASDERSNRKTVGYFLVTASASKQKVARDAMFMTVGGVL